MKFLADNRGIREFQGHAFLLLELTSPGAISTANDLTKGLCEVDLKRRHKDRTLNQNAMLWKLIGDISLKENGKRNRETDMEIYRRILKLSGASVEVFSIRKDALPGFIRKTKPIFSAHEVAMEWTSKGTEWVMVYGYYGTSQMDTSEMGKVIDRTLEYAAEIGLDAEYWREQFDYTEG
jgi:hypothetical protein